MKREREIDAVLFLFVKPVKKNESSSDSCTGSEILKQSRLDSLSHTHAHKRALRLSVFCSVQSDEDLSLGAIAPSSRGVGAESGSTGDGAQCGALLSSISLLLRRGVVAAVGVVGGDRRASR